MCAAGPASTPDLPPLPRPPRPLPHPLSPPPSPTPPPAPPPGLIPSPPDTPLAARTRPSAPIPPSPQPRSPVDPHAPSLSLMTHLPSTGLTSQDHDFLASSHWGDQSLGGELVQGRRRAKLELRIFFRTHTACIDAEQKNICQDTGGDQRSAISEGGHPLRPPL